MRFARIFACAAIMVGTAVSAQAQAPTQKVAPEVVDRVITATFKGATQEWKDRIKQDESQALCSQYRNNLPPALSTKVLEAEKKKVVMPADGKVMGNWKAGAVVAQTGTGGQFSDKPGGRTGGNCYACHRMSQAELSFGTMGPSLNHYGKDRKFKEDDAKAAYAKIHNSQSVLPCSNMPRFGHNKQLTEQQIKDVVAYLFDPESPVNK